MYFVIKSLFSGLLIAVIATASRRSSFLGALIASLPLTSLLSMIWLYQETRDTNKIATLSLDILWLVIPSMAFFIVLPIVLKRGLYFYPALLVSSLVTIAAYFSFIKLKEFI